jgi:flagellar biosynthesis GTPase FlhF
MKSIFNIENPIIQSVQTQLNNTTVIIDNKYMYNKHEYTALILLANRLYKSDFYNLVKQLHEDTNQE